MNSADAKGSGERWRLATWFALIGIIVIADQMSKAWILANFRLHESHQLGPWLNLVLVFNSGAAFSFLAQESGWQKWFFVLLAFGISTYLLRLLRDHARERLLPTALTLIIGGALGNVIDRLRFDAVVDFIDVHALGYHWPAFNVADSGISVGVALMLWHQLRFAKDSP